MRQCLLGPLLSLLRGVPRDVSSPDDTVSLFAFSKSLRPAFHGGCSMQRVPPRGAGPPPRQRPGQRSLCFRLLLLVYVVVALTAAILTGARCRLITVSICVSLTIGDAEHLFMCLLPIFMSSLQKFLFECFAHLNRGGLVSLLLLSLLNPRSPLCHLAVSPLQIFSLILRLAFHRDDRGPG